MNAKTSRALARSPSVDGGAVTPSACRPESASPAAALRSTRQPPRESRPAPSTDPIAPDRFGSALTRALHAVYPTHLEAANDAGVTPAAAKNWWQGRHGMNGYCLHRLQTVNPDFATALAREVSAEIAEANMSPAMRRVLANAAAEAVDGGFCGQE